MMVYNIVYKKINYEKDKRINAGLILPYLKLLTVGLMFIFYINLHAFVD